MSQASEAESLGWRNEIAVGDRESAALERADAALATITANRKPVVVKRTVDWLLRAGWSVVTHPGYEHGHDIEPARDNGQRWIIEAKGCVAGRAGDHNNFRALLGDILMKRVEGGPLHPGPTALARILGAAPGGEQGSARRDLHHRSG